MKRLLILLLCTGFISMVGCYQSSVYPNKSNPVIIEVVIDQNAQLFFEGTPIEYNNFSKICATRISELGAQNIATGDIFVALKVYNPVETKIIKDLQSQLRNLDIRKVFYSIIQLFQADTNRWSQCMEAPSIVTFTHCLLFQLIACLTGAGQATGQYKLRTFVDLYGKPNPSQKYEYIVTN